MFEEDGDGSSKWSEKPSDNKIVVRNTDPTSAYLGPKNIFSNPITQDDLMDDDSNSGGEMVNINDVFNISGSSMPASPENLSRPSIIVPVKKETVKLEPTLQKGGNDFLYVESKRARLEREKEERKRKF